VSFSTKGEKAPACGDSVPAWKLGAKGPGPEEQAPPPAPEVIWKMPSSVTGGPPDQGVSTAETACEPQVDGVVSGPRSPPRKWRRKWENGSWGMSSATAVS
jgi:hypothetical protein